MLIITYLVILLFKRYFWNLLINHLRRFILKYNFISLKHNWKVSYQKEFLSKSFLNFKNKNRKYTKFNCKTFATQCNTNKKIH